MTNQKFIFGNWVSDFLLLHLPTYLIIAYFGFFRDVAGSEVLQHQIIAFIILAFIDSGHVYTTVWRTYFNKKEAGNRSLFFWWPLIIFSLLTVSSFFLHRWFWISIQYFTLYHNLRQLYGYYRWYGSLSRFKDRFLDFMFYAICLTPVLIFQTGPLEPNNSLSLQRDILLFENMLIYKLAWIFYGSLLLGFVSYVLWKSFRKQPLSLPMVLFMVTSFVLYNRAFIPAKSGFDIIGPLAFTHGIAYIGSIVLSLLRIDRVNEERPILSGQFFKLGLPGIIAIVCMTAAVFGAYDFFFEEFLIERNDLVADLGNSLLIGIWMTPLILHYHLDSKIWRHTHSEFKAVAFGQ